MTSISRQAFIDSERVRWSHRKILLNQFQKGFKGTNRQLAKRVRMPYEAVHKRTSELLNDGKITIIGSIDCDGYQNSVYKLSSEPELFTVKKITFSQWAKKNHPDIFAEYEKFLIKT
jgi:DNA-binding Lrp family transcriptional regulator